MSVTAISNMANSSSTAAGSECRWTPVRSWTDADLDAIAARFAGHAEAWASEWMMRPACVGLPTQLSVARALSVPAQGSVLVLPLQAESGVSGGDAPKAWLCFATSDQFARRDPLVNFGMRLVLGTACRAEKGSIATELGIAALEKLVADVCNVVGAAPQADLIDEKRLLAALPGTEFHALAGCVKVALPLAEDIALFLNGAAAQKLVREDEVASTARMTGGLTNVREATAAGQVRLDFQLNQVELTFGQLKSLQVGDVVVLPHSIEAPLRLVTQFDTEIGRGFLGRLDLQRAIQVVRRESSGDTSMA
ncbi:MAG: FliM/FliN family flagellar motor C-terminal domain-containing protein [Massilia sp.]